MGWSDGDRLTAKIATWLDVIQGQYLEKPTLQLTLSQAGQRFGMDELTSAALLGALVHARFLRETMDGAFVRADWSEN